MPKIQSFEVDRWSEPDEHRRVKHIGMAKSQDIFDKLEAHLKRNNLLPDEYFLFDGGEYGELPKELPNYEVALCIPNYGASEGIYLDISLKYYDKDGRQRFVSFATGKTLGESADDFYKMSRIAAECSLLLNGRGQTYERENVDLTLTPEELSMVGGLVEEALCNPEYYEPEAIETMEAISRLVDQNSYITENILMRHGTDDFSLWTVELSSADVQQLLHDSRLLAKGDLETFMGSMPADAEDRSKLHLLLKGIDCHELRTCPVNKDFWTAHQDEGCSVRGTLEDIVLEVTQQHQTEADAGMEP